MKKYPHTEIQKRYVGRKYRGKRNGSQFTITVVDTTFGGDVVVRHHILGVSTWSQRQFLEWVESAKEVSPSRPRVQVPPEPV